MATEETIMLRSLPGRERTSLIPSPSRKRRPSSSNTSNSSSSVASSGTASSSSSIQGEEPPPPPPPLPLPNFVLNHTHTHNNNNSNNLPGSPTRTRPNTSGGSSVAASTEGAGGNATPRTAAAAGGGGGEGGGEHQTSPIRRSQTQAMLATGGGAAGAEGGGGEGEAQGGGAGDKKLAAPPAHPVREGPQYQIEDEKLPPLERFPVENSRQVADIARKGLIWNPHDVEEALVEEFERGLELAVGDGRVNDEGGELGWLLLRTTGSVQKALSAAEDESLRASWSVQEEAIFLEGMNEWDKNFPKIKALLPDRTLKEVVAHFYVWKQGDKYREWKADRPLQYVEQAIPDYHIEVCDSCERPGDLLCCDTCNLAFHMRCIGIDEDAVPDDFSCEQCQRSYTTPADRDRAKRWVETQVNKVQALREKELQKIAGAPSGYIGRRRTKAGQTARGRKRKREDCNAAEEKAQEAGSGGGNPGNTHPPTHTHTTAAADGAGRSAGSDDGGGGGGGDGHNERKEKEMDMPPFLALRSHAQTLPSASSSSLSSNSSSSSASQRLRSGAQRGSAVK